MGKGSNTTTTNTTSSADPRAAAVYEQILQRAQGVASTPYQAYTGDLTAPVNAQQNLGIGNINASANYASPYLAQAQGLASGAANPLSASQIAQYQSPYTQQVVDATQAQFNRNNAQQQAALRGNQIASGALGGNRAGISAANLSSQQATQQNPIIAGLYDKSYSQGLATANQQFQQNPLAASGAIANYGIAGQGAALSGAGAQLGAGTLQQQTEQQRLNALYQQYQQAQAFPYQQTQWLAGIGTGVGSQLGGTSQGTTTGPTPSPWGQIIGGGLAAASLFLNRGGRVTGDEGVVPHMAEGGVSGSPWSGGVGWIPQINIHPGKGAPQASAPSPPKEGGSSFDASKFASGLAGLGKAGGRDWGGLMSAGVGNLSGDSWGGGSFWGGDAFGGSSASPLPGLSAADYGEGFVAGGGVGFAAGGTPFEDRFDAAFPNMAGPDPELVAEERRRAGMEMLRRGEGSRLVPEGVVNPDEPFRMPDREAVEAWRRSAPLPNQGLAPAAARPSDDELPETAEPAQGTLPSRGVAAAGYTPTPYQPPPKAPPAESGFGLGLLSPNAKTALLTAGLGMLASRSPNLGNAIGEGGLAGLSAYGAAEGADRKAAEEAEKLSREVWKSSEDLKLRGATQNETARHNRATEENASKDKVPQGMRLNASGVLEEIPGYAETLAKIAAAKRPKTGDLMDDDTAEFMAERVLEGDTRALVGLGRGAQGSENIAKIQRYVVQKAKERGVDAKGILRNVAEQAYNMSGARALGTKTIHFGTAEKAMEESLPVARAASALVPRTQWKMLTELIQKGQTQINDPNLKKFLIATDTAAKDYARTINPTGTLRESDIAYARKILSTADSEEAYNAGLDQLKVEASVMARALERQKKELLSGKSEAGHGAPAGAPATAPASGFKPPPGAIPRTYNGKTYYYDPATKQPYPGQ